MESQAVDEPQASRFTWTIDNFSRLTTKKLYSDVFVVGGYKWYLNEFRPFFFIKIDYVCTMCAWLCWSSWFIFRRRVLIFPKGNNVDHLSMYLDVADSSTLPYGWSRYAQFSLAVVNQIHSKYTIKKGILYIAPMYCLWSCTLILKCLLCLWHCIGILMTALLLAGIYQLLS